MLQRAFLVFAVLVLPLNFPTNFVENTALAAGSENHSISVILETSAPEKLLKTWSVDDFKGQRPIASREKDPETGEFASWTGVLLSKLVDQAFQNVSVQDKAQVDLLILKGKNGQRAFIPRSLIGKYPLLLAWARNGKTVGERGPWYSVVPWSSKPRIQSEDLPLERLFLADVTTIELTNYRNLYNAYYLQRRTDPSAMRGEKIYVQNCLSCHASGAGPSLDAVSIDARDRALASSNGHSGVKGAPRLDDRSRRALNNYWDAYKLEHPPSTAAGVAPNAQASVH